MLVAINLSCNKKNIFIENETYNSETIQIIFKNSIFRGVYIYHGISSCCYAIETNSKYYYSKFFCLPNGSLYRLCKDYNFRVRILHIQNIIYNLFYSYFINNKYYNSNVKTYSKMLSISYKKIFNCRDYYKIHSYIISR